MNRFIKCGFATQNSERLCHLFLPQPSSTNKFGRDAGDDAISGNIFQDDSARTDDAIVSDSPMI